MNSKEYSACIIRELRACSDAHNAVGMSAYMRNQFPFLGISTPRRRSIISAHIQQHKRPENPVEVAVLLWEQREREFQYAACDILAKCTKQLGVNDVPNLEPLITSKSWWDTVDYLVPKILAAILRNNRAVLKETCYRWITNENIWLQRSAIIIQLGYKDETDEELLFNLIYTRASSKEFFVQKGSGWALRQYSYQHPTAVREFITKYDTELSALTKREGGKYC